jgi:rhodanese-related sulfurtransferase
MTTPATSHDLALLRRLQPIGSLSEDSLRELLPLSRKASFVRGSDPMSGDEWAGQVVYLARGELKVDAVDGTRDVLVGGSGRALSPISREGKRPLATRAITTTELIGFTEDPLDVLVTWDQLATPVTDDGNGHGDAPDWRQMSGMFAVQNLTQGAFSSLPAASIAPLLERFVRMPVKRGDVIVRQGDEGDYYYLIERGRCKVTRQVAGDAVELAELTEGNAFGEEALVADAQRNATVAMKTDGVLLRLAKEDFNTLLREPLLHRVDAAAARAQVLAGATWIDVRFPAEFRQDGLSGAINIPLNEIRQAASSLDANKKYIAYCQSGRRSSAAAFLLSQRGIRTSLLDGGLNALSADTEKHA